MDIGGDYAGPLLGFSNTCGSLSGIIGNLLVGYLLEEAGTTEAGWTSVFVSTACVYVVGWAVYLLCAGADEIVAEHTS